MNLKSETCACGSAANHTMLGGSGETGATIATSAAGMSSLSSSNPSGQFRFFFWCRKCGAIRRPFKKLWEIPLDRSGDVSATALREAEATRAYEEEEPPTKPDNPVAKKK